MTTVTAQQQQIQAAHQQVLSALREAEARILPAKLVDPAKDGPNGHTLAAYFKQHNLAPTADNFEAAFKALFETLEWVPGFEPKKLLLQRESQNPKLAHQGHQAGYELEREVKARANEKADAAQKSSAAGYKAARSAVAAYQPLRGQGRSTIDYPEQEATQTALTKHINAEEARGVDGNAVLEKVAAYIQGRYEVSERRRERI